MSQITHRDKSKVKSENVVSNDSSLNSEPVADKQNNELYTLTETLKEEDAAGDNFSVLDEKKTSVNSQNRYLKNLNFSSKSSIQDIGATPIKSIIISFCNDKKFWIIFAVLVVIMTVIITVIVAVVKYEKNEQISVKAIFGQTVIKHDSNEDSIYSASYWNSIKGDCGVSVTKPNFDVDQSDRGTTVKVHSWPWEVSIVRYYNYKDGYTKLSLLCGGAIVSENVIVTATSCFYNSTSRRVQTYTAQLRVIIGGHKKNELVEGARLLTIRSVFVHEKNNLETLLNERRVPYNDIAVILLDENLNFQNYRSIINFICLPRPHMLPPVGSRCWLVGFGDAGDREYDGFLKQIPQVLISQTRCQRSYGNSINYNKHLCAREHYFGACDGDVGGPLMCLGSDLRWTLYGVVSFSPLTCVTGPSVFTSITKYVEWICCISKDFLPCSKIGCKQ